MILQEIAILVNIKNRVLTFVSLYCIIRKKAGFFMKNKSTVSVVISVLMLALSLFLVSCKAGKKEDVVGTYKLVTDTRTVYGEDTVDNIKKYGKEAYLVITGKDYGYYVYKDDSSPVIAREVKLEYSYNEEGNISLVGFITGEGERTNSFNVNAMQKVSLISRWPSASKYIDAYDIQYDKVDKSTDLSYVKNVYADLPIFGYDLYKYNALYRAEVVSESQNNPGEYVYKYYDVDSSKRKATFYYALKSDEKPVVVTDLTVSFEFDSETKKPVSMSIGEDKYDLTLGTPSRSVKITVEGESVDAKEELYNYNYLNLLQSDYDTYFQGLIAEYRNSLQETEAAA